MDNPPDLYGPSGKPSAEDIAQGEHGDCYFLAPLGSLATQQPQVIQQAIDYNANDQSFDVRFYIVSAVGGKLSPQPVTVNVTQADLQGNRDSQGVNSPGYWPSQQTSPPLWPEVMETAYAKFRDEYPNEFLQDKRNNIGDGGIASEAIFAVTGQLGGTHSILASELSDPDKAYEDLHGALDAKRPVLLATNAMPPKQPDDKTPDDGLTRGIWDDDPAKRMGHYYMVEKVDKSTQGDVMLTLRNPLGHNEGVNSNNPTPTIEVNLKDIIDNKHLDRIDIGPKPAPHQDQEQEPQPASPANSQPQQEQQQDAAVPAVTGDPYMDRLLATMDDPAAFGQALDDLAHSPHGEAFRAEGRAQYAEQENQQLRQQQEEQAQPQQQPQPAQPSQPSLS
jgi:hypothetical protein